MTAATLPKLRLLAHPDQCDVSCCDFQPEGHWHGPTDALQQSFEKAVDAALREQTRITVDLLRDSLEVQRTGCDHEDIGRPGCRTCDPRVYPFRAALPPEPRTAGEETP